MWKSIQCHQVNLGSCHTPCLWIAPTDREVYSGYYCFKTKRGCFLLVLKKARFQKSTCGYSLVTWSITPSPPPRNPGLQNPAKPMQKAGTRTSVFRRDTVTELASIGKDNCRNLKHLPRLKSFSFFFLCITVLHHVKLHFSSPPPPWK